MKIDYHSLGAKITLLVMAGTVSIFAIILAYSYMASRTIILDDAKQSASGIVESHAMQMQLELKSATEATDHFAQVVERADLKASTLLILLKELVERQHQVFGSAVAFEPYAFDKSIRAYAPYCHLTRGGTRFVQLGTESYDYFKKAWYSKPKQSRTDCWSPPYLDEGGGGVVMVTYSQPFFHIESDGSRGSFRGVVTADISVAWLTERLSRIHAGKNGYCFLISDKGIFLTHPREAWIMRESLFSVAQSAGNKELTHVADLMLKRPAGFVQVKDVLTGEDSYVAFKRIPATGWTLAAVFLKKDIYSKIDSLLATTRFIAIVGIGLLMLSAVLLARSITRPLRRLARAARLVADGGLDVKLADTHRRDEVGRLASAFADMTVDLKKHIADLARTAAAKERIETELNVAAQIQTSMLPRSFPAFPERDDFDIYAVMRPAREVGGDFYQFFLLDDQTLCIAIGDVSGKGVPASLFMAVTMFLTHSLATEMRSPGAILTRLNEELLRGNDSCMFVTVFCGILDLKTGDLVYSNGGHNHPIILTHSGVVEDLASQGGPMVGVLEGVSYELGVLRLQAGDTIVMFTDGVTEAENGSGGFYTEGRLRDTLSKLQGRTVTEVVEGVLSDLNSFSGDVPASDDTTIMAAQFRGGSA